MSASAPVFMLSPPRSFSTVSIALLSGHPGIFGFPELGLLRPGTVAEVLRGDRQPLYRRDLYLSGLMRAVAEVHEQDQGDDAVARAASWLARHEDWTSLELLHHLVDQVEPAIAVDKTPDNAYEPDLAAMLQSFPQARVIHLTRHPVTTQRSMREHWAPVQRSMSERQRSRLCAASWYLSHTRILRTLADLPPGRWRRVRAEDLVSRPEETARGVFDWLQLPYDEEVLRGLRRTEEWIFAGTGQSGTLFGGDWKFLSQPRLRPIPDPGPVDFPAEWDLPEQMVAQTRSLASSLGYG